MMGGMGQISTMSGANVVKYSNYDSSSKPILGQMSAAQISAANTNPDLRKKLRVDRVRKMTMGNSATIAAVEDPS